MSDELFPELPGLEWELTKTPIFNTKIMTSINGRELRASYQAVPKYEFGMSFGFLRESQNRQELQKLEGFFLDRRGAFDSFLLRVPEDCDFNCSFIGDGLTTSFQIFKSLANRQIPLSHTKPIAAMKINPLMWNITKFKPMWDSSSGKLMWNNSNATVSNSGVLNLSSPLEPGIEISIKGTYYYRCRFKDDEQQYTNFMSKLWKASKVEMIGSLGNKV